MDWWLLEIGEGWRVGVVHERPSARPRRVGGDAEAVQLASDALQLARPGTPPAQRAADALLSRAQKLGTTDNTTVLVVVL